MVEVGSIIQGGNNPFINFLRFDKTNRNIGLRCTLPILCPDIEAPSLDLLGRLQVLLLLQIRELKYRAFPSASLK